MTQGNVFGNPRAVIDSSQTLYEGIFHSWNQIAAGGNTVRESTGRLVAKSEEQFSGTIPLPSFHEFFLTITCPLKSMADQQRLQISELNFDRFPTLSTFSCWKIRFKNLGVFLFWFSLGNNVMDQRSGDV